MTEYPPAIYARLMDHSEVARIAALLIERGELMGRVLGAFAQNPQLITRLESPVDEVSEIVGERVPVQVVNLASQAIASAIEAEAEGFGL